jgi:hypothetical protein
MPRKSSKAMKPLKKTFKILENSSLLKSKVVLYLTLLLSIAVALVYISKNKWDALTALVAVGILTNYFTKNMTITLGISILVSLVVFSRDGSRLTLEGNANMDALADEASPDEFAEAEAEDAGDEEGEATGESMSNNKDPTEFCFVRDSKTNKYRKNSETKVTADVCSAVPQSCWASSASDCRKQSGFSNKDIPSSKPQRVDGKSDIEDDDESEGHRIDYSKTLEAAYDNLQDVLGKEGIKGLTGETTKLIDEQKNLMKSMQSIGPMMNQATAMMSSLKKMNVGGALSQLKGK